MIPWLVQAALRRRGLVLIGAAVIAAFGVWAFRQQPIDVASLYQAAPLRNELTRARHRTISKSRNLFCHLLCGQDLAVPRTTWNQPFSLPGT